MPKRDLKRVIDLRPTSAIAAGGVVVVPTTTGGTNVDGDTFVGRREGPHVGLFRLDNDEIFLQAADTGGTPFFSVGGVDYETNATWIRIGYAEKKGIRLKAPTRLNGQPEEHRDMEVDAECLVGTIPGSLGLTADCIKDTHIDWGTGSGQVSAADVPIADTGTYYTTDNVEAALQQAAGWRGILRKRVITDTDTAAATDDLIVCNKATAMTVNLPAATGSGKLLIIKSIGAGVVTVDGADAETIDGETTQTLNQWDSMSVCDYASGVWAIV